jgi:peroxiredoxin
VTSISKRSDDNIPKRGVKRRGECNNSQKIQYRREAQMANESADQSKILQAGQRAPDFELEFAPDKTLRLSSLRGRPVILAFYPNDWSPVCGEEMVLFNAVRAEFARHYAQLLGISVDSAWCHVAFAEDRKLKFPLLSDFEPKGAVSRLYGAYREPDGTSERALFVIDADGAIRWSYLSPIDVNPGADGILQALESLSLRKAS